MTFRWTPEAVADHERRMEQLKAEGRVKTHRIEKEPRAANRRGGRVSKYGNIRVEADGQKFDSKAERGRWMDLRLLETAGEIKDLTRQITYPLEVNGVHICDYKADFVYIEKDELVVEDTKGYRTREFMLKAKLMLACHGITILESE